MKSGSWGHANKIWSAFVFLSVSGKSHEPVNVDGSLDSTLRCIFAFVLGLFSGASFKMRLMVCWNFAAFMFWKQWHRLETLIFSLFYKKKLFQLIPKVRPVICFCARPIFSQSSKSRTEQAIRRGENKQGGIYSKSPLDTSWISSS